MPSPLEWGKFIEKVLKGMLDAITMLGLIDEDTIVPQAFVELDKFVNCVLTAEEKAAMTYDVLTSEHGLLLLQMLQKDIHKISIYVYERLRTTTISLSLSLSLRYFSILSESYTWLTSGIVFHTGSS
ncbi:uncharacterized protein LACBIDRAFT_327420 [Laccaria bicolor S238N-H82]|uniref:Predicted protein n=1 Tax=Laccaria bicolor (strain S238N-H82 / ATCC MYA-4686) TaxID=486041 RepID=B0DB09_LACBS|nr:uncharacterized protein LACBIDRAFT_327420 [Laccaria bicolor S238N-H82]EDR08123.1 predicted protein [Laccaria bicolor S238N-H82]|eukprot:XP_001881193.1 predicted protein [Laccaria bicolor S238N-H82]